MVCPYEILFNTSLSKKTKLNIHKSEAFINYGETCNMTPFWNFMRQSFEGMFHMSTKAWLEWSRNFSKWNHTIYLCTYDCVRLYGNEETWRILDNRFLTLVISRDKMGETINSLFIFEFISLGKKKEEKKEERRKEKREKERKKETERKEEGKGKKGGEGREGRRKGKKKET